MSDSDICENYQSMYVLVFENVVIICIFEQYIAAQVQHIVSVRWSSRWLSLVSTRWFHAVYSDFLSE